MDPWNIIGWLILVWAAITGSIVLLFIGGGILNEVRKAAYRYYKHVKTREIPPEGGQLWFFKEPATRWGSSYVEIANVSQEGQISVGIGSWRWSVTHEEWAKMIRKNWSYLQRDASGTRLFDV